MENNQRKTSRFSEFVRSDLACEQFYAGEGSSGIESSEQIFGRVSLNRIKICENSAAKMMNRALGTYITISFPPLWTGEDFTATKTVRELLCEQIRMLAFERCRNYERVLVVGIGNSKLTADSVGPCVAGKIIVTRHIKKADPSLFAKIGQKEVAVSIPGVIGDTGIEACETIKNAVDTVKPDLVVLIDALASRSIERLATTIQISDTGLSPGSGVGNNRGEINEKTLGVPTVAIGVPTIMDSSTLVYDALDRAGIEDVPAELKQILENSKSYFVCVKDCDEAIIAISDVIAFALDKAFEAQTSCEPNRF